MASELNCPGVSQTLFTLEERNGIAFLAQGKEQIQNKSKHVSQNEILEETHTFGSDRLEHETDKQRHRS